MITRKRNLSVVGTTSALAIFALAGTATAQQTPEHSNDSPVTRAAQQAANPHQAQAATDASKMATMFGVSELNDIEDWKVTNAGTEVGEIDRIAVDRDTGELLAVVGLEGVVGVNMKEVAIPLSELKKAGEETLSTDLTKEELQRKRDIDPWDGVYSQGLDEDAAR
jgi:PRC-barrel domain